MTKAQALALFHSSFWLELSAYDRAKFQLFEDRLCMPFGVFHEALEEALDRPVMTHELGLNRDGLQRELLGIDPMPSMDDIINLIPDEKRIIIQR